MAVKGCPTMEVYDRTLLLDLSEIEMEKYVMTPFRSSRLGSDMLMVKESLVVAVMVTLGGPLGPAILQVYN